MENIFQFSFLAVILAVLALAVLSFREITIENKWKKLLVQFLGPLTLGKYHSPKGRILIAIQVILPFAFLFIYLLYEFSKAK